MPKCPPLHRDCTRAALCALALLAHAAGAAEPAARCPASNESVQVTAQWSNNVLRCQRVAIAKPACPPTHAGYVVQPGLDVCKANGAGGTAGATAPPTCPPSMQRLSDAGEASRDQCRGAAGYVAPVLGTF